MDCRVHLFKEKVQKFLIRVGPRLAATASWGSQLHFCWAPGWQLVLLEPLASPGVPGFSWGSGCVFLGTRVADVAAGAWGFVSPAPGLAAGAATGAWNFSLPSSRFVAGSLGFTSLCCSPAVPVLSCSLYQDTGKQTDLQKWDLFG